MTSKERYQEKKRIKLLAEEYLKECEEEFKKENEMKEKGE